MADSLIFINFLIFILLSFLHFYWALGGKWAIDYTIPDQFKESCFN